MRVAADDHQTGVVAVEPDEAGRRRLGTDWPRGIRRIDSVAASERVVRVLLSCARAARREEGEHVFVWNAIGAEVAHGDEITGAILFGVISVLAAEA